MYRNEFIESIRQVQAEQRKAVEETENIRAVDVAVEEVKKYVKDFVADPEHCFCTYICLRWYRVVDEHDTVCYRVFDENKESNIICTIPKVMLHEFSDKLSNVGLEKSASLDDHGCIKLDWSW